MTTSMHFAKMRAQLRSLEYRGAIRSWFEKSPGNFIVSVAAGPNQHVRSRRDLDALESALRAKAAHQ